MRLLLLLIPLMACTGKGGDTGEAITDEDTETTDTVTTDTTDTGPPQTTDTDTATDTTNTTDTTDTSGSTDGGETGDTGGSTTTGETGDTGGVEGPLEGFGELTGDCWGLDKAELTGADPALIINTLDFGKDAFDYDALSEGGQEVYDDGNLGGSSEYSEIFSYEVLYRCEGAELLKTEGEIAYLDSNGKKTDLLVSIDGINIAVSVTRAFIWPGDEPYTAEEAAALLEDKLADIPLSTANRNPDKNPWTKQILHVIAYTSDHAEVIRGVYPKLASEVLGDTILVVTATEGNDEHLY